MDTYDMHTILFELKMYFEHYTKNFKTNYIYIIHNLLKSIDHMRIHILLIK